MGTMGRRPSVEHLTRIPPTLRQVGIEAFPRRPHGSLATFAEVVAECEKHLKREGLRTAPRLASSADGELRLCVATIAMHLPCRDGRNAYRSPTSDPLHRGGERLRSSAQQQPRRSGVRGGW